MQAPNSRLERQWRHGSVDLPRFDPIRPLAMARVVAATVTSAAPGGTINLSFEDCGDAGTLGTIKVLEPSFLILSGTITLVGSGGLSQDVSGGRFSSTRRRSVSPSFPTAATCARTNQSASHSVSAHSNTRALAAPLLQAMCPSLSMPPFPLPSRPSLPSWTLIFVLLWIGNSMLLLLAAACLRRLVHAFPAR